MKTLILILLSMGVTIANAADKIAKNGIVFTDSGTFEVELAQLGPESDNTYLVRFKGYDDENAEKVFKVTTTGGGTGARYYEKEDGTNFLRAPAHNYFGWEAYVGNKTFKISKNDKKTKALNTADLLKNFKK